ncbi:putative TIM-barrel fold metal-dependent hydrolase [Paraburkholderia unamae]|uniref:amidohydrolase family protein n=1 Tax=Paraburkholderia unamae TaxID=219649 RepID=UPI000DC2688C|nr:amidohydrolase family protein [Paraburkholderia unamae]RAR55381.1 putative TIM-barrel fold metal-dependent hydrolase [Paraburkholderia unamae]
MSDPSPKNLSFVVPANACDSHQHVIGDSVVFPMAPGRSYTPPEAPLSRLEKLHRTFGFERAVLVQPSFYGTDNSCLLDALNRLGRSARGIAVIDRDTNESALDHMHDVGVRGVRVNPKGFANDSTAIARLLNEFTVRVASRGWHVQTFLPLPTIAALERTLIELPTPVVIDHFGGATADGLNQPGIASLFRLLDSGNCYVKLSAPYHASHSAHGYPEMLSLARELIARRSDRILWGSNWPHTNASLTQGRTALDINPFLDIDETELFDLISAWAPDPKIQQAMLVDNPRNLFDF